MAVADYKDHTSYHLDIMTIVNNEGEAFDVRQLFMQCFINESIYDNFLSGEVVIADSIGLLEKVKFSGQESIRIRFHQPAGGPGLEVNEDDVIDKVFRIYRVNDLKRTHAHSQVFNLMFASPEMLDAKRIRISQTFKGEVLSLAAKIAEDNLNIKNRNETSSRLEPSFEMRAPAMEEHQVTIPNWTVQETINWLCSKAQANNYDSSPIDSYFFYQTANGNYIINSIRDMLGIRYNSANHDGDGKFVYTDYGDERRGPGNPVATYDAQGAPPLDVLGAGRRILDYYMSSTSSVLDATTSGLLSSKLFTINNTLKMYQEKSYDYLERFFNENVEHIDSNPFIRTSPETLYIGAKQGAPDEDTTTDGIYNTYKPLNQYNDAMHLLLNQSNYVNDTKDIVQSVNGSAHFGGQQMRQAVGQLLKFHTIQCLISTRTDISCGQVINLVIPKSDPVEEYNEGSQFHDGLHLITNVQWSFNPMICNTNIVCMKDSLRNNLELTEATYGSGE